MSDLTKLAKQFASLAMVAATLVLTGCASNPHNPRDPLEGFNRAMFSFNDTVDRTALKPAAKVYETVLPSFVQTGVSNFFGNIGDIPTALNNLLQGKVTDGLSDIMRVAVNSTIGLVGLIDVGSEAGLTKHREDFGQTLGKWGVSSGPYVVLPFLGSSTMRDSVALPVDYVTDPWAYKYPVRWRNTGSLIRVIDERAVVLDASSLIEDAALDRYEFIRDAYLQRRESKIRDGEGSKAAPDKEAAPKPKENSRLTPGPADKAEPVTVSSAESGSQSSAEHESGNGEADAVASIPTPDPAVTDQ